MRSVLLLNASFEVLRAVSLGRAVVLVLEDKAEIVEDTGEYVRSPSVQIPMPSVIRLKTFVKVPWKAKVALNRKNLVARDDGECQKVGCARRGDTIDHVQPRSRGGRHEWTNVTLMCGKHNQEKGDRLLSELGWTLKHQPTLPTRTIVLGITDPAWEPHLNLAG